MNKTKYEKCKHRVVDGMMKKYEKGGLKNSQGRRVKEHKQAIAMALSISEQECKKFEGKDDFTKMRVRLMKRVKSDRPLGRTHLQQFQRLLTIEKSRVNRLNLICLIQQKMISMCMRDDVLWNQFNKTIEKEVKIE